MENQVLVVLYKINDSLEYCVQGVCYYILSKKTSSSDRHRVAVHHSEALLENGVLRLGWSDLLLSMIPVEVFLELRIYNEHWPNKKLDFVFVTLFDERAFCQVFSHQGQFWDLWI